MAQPDTNFDIWEYANTYDYGVWQPGTTITLCAPRGFDNTYKHVQTYASEASKKAYFDVYRNDAVRNTTLQLSSAERVKIDGGIVKLPVPLYKASGMTYAIVDMPANPVDEREPLTLYYYITGYEYLAPNTTALTLQLDLWTMYMGIDDKHPIIGGYLLRGHMPMAKCPALTDITPTQYDMYLSQDPAGYDGQYAQSFAYDVQRYLTQTGNASSSAENWYWYMIITNNALDTATSLGARPDTTTMDNVSYSVGIYFCTITAYSTILTNLRANPSIAAGIKSITMLPWWAYQLYRPPYNSGTAPTISTIYGDSLYKGGYGGGYTPSIDIPVGEYSTYATDLAGGGRRSKTHMFNPWTRYTLEFSTGEMFEIPWKRFFGQSENGFRMKTKLDLLVKTYLTADGAELRVYPLDIDGPYDWQEGYAFQGSDSDWYTTNTTFMGHKIRGANSHSHALIRVDFPQFPFSIDGGDFAYAQNKNRLRAQMLNAASQRDQAVHQSGMKAQIDYENIDLTIAQAKEANRTALTQRQNQSQYNQSAQDIAMEQYTTKGEIFGTIDAVMGAGSILGAIVGVGENIAKKEWDKSISQREYSNAQKLLRQQTNTEMAHNTRAANISARAGAAISQLNQQMAIDAATNTYQQTMTAIHAGIADYDSLSSMPITSSGLMTMLKQNFRIVFKIYHAFGPSLQRDAAEKHLYGYWYNKHIRMAWSGQDLNERGIKLSYACDFPTDYKTGTYWKMQDLYWNDAATTGTERQRRVRQDFRDAIAGIFANGVTVWHYDKFPISNRAYKIFQIDGELVD